MSVPGANAVIDLSHHQNSVNFQRIKEDGIVAVVHKATEGSNYKNRTYSERRDKAKAAGLRWGSYHFSSGSNATIQFENYVNFAKPTDDELICLDFEPSFSGVNMSYEGLLEFVGLCVAELGRYPVIYGGSLLRETTRGRSGDPVLTRCPLWFARYSPSPIGLPDPWRIWTLWQYTDGNAGQSPYSVEGVGRCDRDTFNGPLERLVEAWPLTHRV
ncbi:glycoside hydrolase family 25 protein [Jiella sonneratiae]|uniref:Glycoside hydrolase family 25 protein n=1 Tax=Jiella sonneratiae TaxID=2816856 RepID=A0ABS3J8M4_9HYPH|nr:glycoside hydrolase family 25 protein [Jiella sonneratiae]MBO0906027.1 glycoside hydrolase family 25 protein [Jiella sonneratiae]